MKHNVAPHLRIKSSKLMKNLLLGNFKAAFSGKGIEFQDFRSYSYGDDAKYIDWATSTREWNIVLRRYKEEKDAHILCVLDITEAYDPWKESIKQRLQEQVTELIAEIALASGESFGGFRMERETVAHIAPKKNISALLSLLQRQKSQARDIKKALWVSFLVQYPMKRAIIFVISESVYIDEKSFLMASKKHDIVFIHLSTHFENTLQSTDVRVLSDGNILFSVDSSDEHKRCLYEEKRTEQLQTLKQTLLRMNIESIFLDETKNLFSEFYLLMKRKERQYIS